MLRHSRLVMLVLVAMFVVAAPAAIAQTPVDDQYQTSDPGGPGATTEDSGAAPAEDTAGADDSGAAPVEVSNVTAATADRLPFTGGQVALVALIGLLLLALGAAGLAVTRRRAANPA